MFDDSRGIFGEAKTQLTISQLRFVVPQGHINKILSQRHRVLSKVTATGESTYFPLHDHNSNYYADAEAIENCTASKLDGSEGDVMMIEPHYWYKGINDRLNQKHYSCFSSNEKMPSTPVATVILWDALISAGLVRQNYKLLTGKGSLANAYSGDSNYSVVHVHLSGFTRVRFPSVNGSGFVGSIMTNEDGDIVKEVMVDTISGGFENGIIIADLNRPQFEIKTSPKSGKN